jgi:CheY-like chemotaxis protein
MEAGAADGALSLARELHPAAITLDVLMPGIDGWRVLNELKSNPATADIPIVMISILDGREVALEMGAKAFLAKPFRQDDLVDTVKGAIGHLRGADVLCVDDERATRDMLRRALVAAGARVRTVASGAEALTEVARKLPDAICVDLLMPDMDGFELVARLRGHAAMRRLPIIVLSAHDLDPAEVEMLRGNVERFISKAQAQPADICATLRQTINWSHELELTHAG